jgi:hypothetical protein
MKQITAFTHLPAARPNLRTLGLPAPTPTTSIGQHQVYKKKRVNIAIAPAKRPSENPDPIASHRAGGLIGELSAGAVMVDHAARALSELGLFRHETKLELNRLKDLSDKLVSRMMSQFDLEDGDATNYLSSALGLVAEKFCQLTPAQMDASLQHMDNMAKLNATYVPLPTPTETTLL